MSPFAEFEAWRAELYAAAANFVPPTLGPPPIRLPAVHSPSGLAFWYNVILFPGIKRMAGTAGSISAMLDDIFFASTEQEILVGCARLLQEHLIIDLPTFRMWARELSPEQLAILPEQLGWDWVRLAHLFGHLRTEAFANYLRLPSELLQLMMHIHELWRLLGGDINVLLNNWAVAALVSPPVPPQVYYPDTTQMPAQEPAQPAPTLATDLSSAPPLAASPPAFSGFAAAAPVPGTAGAEAPKLFDKAAFIKQLQRHTKRLTPILLALSMNSVAEDGDIVRAEATLDHALEFEGVTSAQIDKSELGDWACVADSVWDLLKSSDDAKMSEMKLKMKRLVALFGL